MQAYNKKAHLEDRNVPWLPKVMKQVTPQTEEINNAIFQLLLCHTEERTFREEETTFFWEVFEMVKEYQVSKDCVRKLMNHEWIQWILTIAFRNCFIPGFPRASKPGDRMKRLIAYVVSRAKKVSSGDHDFLNENEQLTASTELLIFTLDGFSSFHERVSETTIASEPKSHKTRRRVFFEICKEAFLYGYFLSEKLGKRWWQFMINK